MCKPKTEMIRKLQAEVVSLKDARDAAVTKLQKEIPALTVERDTALGRIVKLEGLLNPPSPPEIFAEIPAADVRALLESLFSDDKGKIYISDKKYRITAISELRRFVVWDNTNLFPYEAEWHDCDDFALSLAGDFAKYPRWSGYPVSFVWGDLLGGHAFSIAIAWVSFEDRTPSVFYIEPQDDHEIAQETVEGMKLWLLPM